MLEQHLLGFALWNLMGLPGIIQQGEAPKIFEKQGHMQIKIISVPIVGGEASNEELNAFLRSRKILQVEQQLIDRAGGAYWSFCIRYIDKQASQGSTERGREKKDYKRILSEEAFGRFSKFRAVRKQVAQDTGVPPFAVFTDEELAGLSELAELTPASMKTVKGVGDKKVEKYGDHFIKAAADEKGE